MAYSRLRRNSDQRKALLRDLVTDIIINERIVTTEAKAKELKKLADKMVTLAKDGSLSARRQAAETVRFEEVKEGQNALQKLFSELGPRYAERNGGYTRMVKLGPRQGDGAEITQIELV
jgi:large subunit ribosomal protein L17